MGAQVDRTQLQLVVRYQVVDVQHPEVVGEVRRPHVARPDVGDPVLDAADQDPDLGGGKETVGLVIEGRFGVCI